MRAKIDIALVREGKLHIQGWAFGRDPETPVKLSVQGKSGEKRDFSYEEVERETVNEAYFPKYEEENGKKIQRKLGFSLDTPYALSKGERVELLIQVDQQLRRFSFDDKKIESFNSHAHKKMEKFLALFQWETVEAVKDTLKKGGLSALWHKSVRKLKSIEQDYDYNEWYKKEKTGAEELSRQRAEVWENPLLFSIVIPVYRPKEAFLRRLLDSILSQT